HLAAAHCEGGAFADAAGDLAGVSSALSNQRLGAENPDWHPGLYVPSAPPDAADEGVGMEGRSGPSAVSSGQTTVVIPHFVRPSVDEERSRSNPGRETGGC